MIGRKNKYSVRTLYSDVKELCKFIESHSREISNSGDMSVIVSIVEDGRITSSVTGDAFDLAVMLRMLTDKASDAYEDAVEKRKNATS